MLKHIYFCIFFSSEIGAEFPYDQNVNKNKNKKRVYCGNWGKQGVPQNKAQWPYYLGRPVIILDTKKVNCCFYLIHDCGINFKKFKKSQIVPSDSDS